MTTADSDSLFQQTRKIRREIKAALPKEALQPQTYQCLYAIPYVLLLVALSSFIYVSESSWWVSAICAIALGLIYSSFAMYTHDLLHGTMTKSKPLQTLIGTFGFVIFCLSPAAWRSWHNHTHHQHTNKSGKDPDCFGFEDYFMSFPGAKYQLYRAPGSGSLYSYLFLFTSFWTQVTNVTFYFPFKEGYFKDFPKARAIIDTLLMYTFWGFVFWLTGLEGFLFIWFIPFLIANFVLSSYIVTQHYLSELTEQNDPLVNSLSVSTTPLIDKLHHNFSYHVEHHMFPSVNHKFMPQIQKELLQRAPERYRCMPITTAIKTIYSTPRLYVENDVLMDYRDRSTIKVADITESN